MAAVEKRSLPPVFARYDTDFHVPAVFPFPLSIYVLPMSASVRSSLPTPRSSGRRLGVCLGAASHGLRKPALRPLAGPGYVAQRPPSHPKHLHMLALAHTEASSHRLPHTAPVATCTGVLLRPFEPYLAPLWAACLSLLRLTSARIGEPPRTCGIAMSYKMRKESIRWLAPRD